MGHSVYMNICTEWDSVYMNIYTEWDTLYTCILENFRMTLGTLLEHPFHFKGAFGKKMSHKKFEALKMTFSAPSQSQKLKKRAKNDQK